MAQKFYTVASPGTQILADKCLIGIFNGIGSGQVVRIYRVHILNNQTTAVTGTQAIFTLNLLSTGSGGILLNAVKHDSQNINVPSQIVMSTNMTYNISSVIRRIPYSTDEPTAASQASSDEFNLIPYLNNIIYQDWCLYNTTLDPFTLREGQGIGLINTTNTNIGVIDCIIEFSLDTV